MSRLSSPKEQTWSQLQERLRKSRERQDPSRGPGLDHGTGPSRRRSVPPNPLPRLESPSLADGLRLTSPELRGSHFSKVPPVATHRPHSEDTISLESYNSDTAQEPLRPDASIPPYNSNGAFHSASEPAYREVQVWDQYTGRRAGTERKAVRDGKGRRKKTNARQASRGFEDDAEDLIYANQLESLDARRRDRYPERGSAGEGPRLVEYDDILGPRELPRVPVHVHGQESTAFVRMQDELFARTFLEYFLTSCLQDDMVLEVALDVMAHAREERDLERQLSWPVLELGQDILEEIIHESLRDDLDRQLSWPVLDLGREILEETVHECLRDVAFIELRASIKGFWSMVLETPSLYKPIARDLIREVIDEEVSTIVPEAISDLVSEYFVQKDVVVDFNLICDEVIAGLLPDIIFEAVCDESILSLADSIIHDEIVSLASSFVEESFASGRPKLPASPDRKLQDKNEIDALADDFLLDSVIFENLLSSRLLPNLQVWNQEEYLDLYMDSLLLDQILGQQLEIVKRRNYTEHCLPLKRFHEKITTNVAIDVVLEELMSHLDEDMAEMDEYELEIDRALRYEPP